MNNANYQQFNETPLSQSAKELVHDNINVQQQDMRGNFIPHLLLRKKIIKNYDSHGNSLLNHMCSYSSAYLPLYLSQIQQGCQVLNAQNENGIAPLDAAAFHSNSAMVNMLIKKGAKLSRNRINNWAIKGGNLQNWSGQIQYQQKEYIAHWAAYLDLPEVLQYFYKNGYPLDKQDSNGIIPIQMALIHRSYKSFEILLGFGLTINQDRVKATESKSLIKIYQQYRKRNYSIPAYILMILYLVVVILATLQYSYAITGGLVFLFYLFLSKKQNVIRNENVTRKLDFHSRWTNSKIAWGTNHISYLLLHLFMIAYGIIFLCHKITGYFHALVFIFCLMVTLTLLINLSIELIGISINQTHDERFKKFNNPNLYKKVIIVEQLNFVYHTFKNPYDKGFIQNWKEYLAL